MEPAQRLQYIEEYYFSRKLKEIKFLESSGKPIINLGVGSPDLQPPQKVTEALVSSINEVNAHSYQGYQGLLSLREAMSAFYRDHYLVHLSPTTEILPLIGSKEGIMLISMTFLNAGDLALVPDPGYPVYAATTKLVGANPITYELHESASWMPDLEQLRNHDLSRVKLMWVNYPHMPTGVKATEQLYEELVEFAREYDILIVNDNPYSFIFNDEPMSILSARKSKEHCLELNSLSKTFNMAGWRVGMVSGHSKHIDALLKVKSNLDSGMFYGIQKGAIEALNCSRMWFISLNSVYEKRRALVWKIADALNCTYDKNAVGLFIWAKLPPHFESEEFTELLLKENHLFVAPGSVFGNCGEGYIRLSLCVPIEDLEEALARL